MGLEGLLGAKRVGAFGGRRVAVLPVARVGRGTSLGEEGFLSVGACSQNHTFVITAPLMRGKHLPLHQITKEHSLALRGTFIRRHQNTTSFGLLFRRFEE